MSPNPLRITANPSYAAGSSRLCPALTPPCLSGTSRCRWDSQHNVSTTWTSLDCSNVMMAYGCDAPRLREPTMGLRDDDHEEKCSRAARRMGRTRTPISGALVSPFVEDSSPACWESQFLSIRERLCRLQGSNALGHLQDGKPGTAQAPEGDAALLEPRRQCLSITEPLADQQADVFLDRHAAADRALSIYRVPTLTPLLCIV